MEIEPFKLMLIFPHQQLMLLTAVDDDRKFETVVKNMLSESDFSQEITFL